jgi:hypothetical protein
MHPYQIEEEVSTRKIIVTIILSIIAAYGLSTLLRLIPNATLWWIDYPSVFGFFGLFICLFNNYLWKLNFIQKLLGVTTPNLNGTWEGEIKSLYNNFTTPLHVLLHIKQTGSKILISLENETSISYSIHASILHSGKSHNFELIYNYINEPKADSGSTLNIHYGTAWFQISDDCKSLEGDYFTGRGRQTYGRMILKLQ